MDIEFLKSIPEDQMEMMMMMQLEKLPDFCGIYSDVSEGQSMEFGQEGQGSTTGGAHHQTMGNSHMGSSATFLNLPNSNISFTGSGPAQGGQGGTEMSFFSNSGNGRWRNGSGNGNGIPTQEQKRNSMAAMREMIFRIAAMQPIHIDPESVKPPKRRNVKISKDPQSVAARHRRERISERIRILQRLVPGGTKMDTASMLDEAIHYVKFLKNQVQSLERAASNRPTTATTGIGFPVPMSSGSYLPMGTKGYQAAQSVQHYLDA